MFSEDRAKIVPRGRLAGSALRVHDALKTRPVTTVKALRARTALSFPAASAAMNLLIDLGIARELTGRRRNRVFAYDRYLALLNEGTDAPLAAGS